MATIERKKAVTSSDVNVSAADKQLLALDKQLDKALNDELKAGISIGKALAAIWEHLHNDPVAMVSHIKELRKDLLALSKVDVGDGKLESDKQSDAFRKYNNLNKHFELFRKTLPADTFEGALTKRVKATKEEKGRSVVPPAGEEEEVGTTVVGNSTPAVTQEVFDAAVIGAKVELLKEILALYGPLGKVCKKSSDKVIHDTAVTFGNALVLMLNEMEK